MGSSRFKQFSSLLPPGNLKGGALVKLDKPDGELYIYIFCDPKLNRLLLFREEQTFNGRRPIDIKEYGNFITTNGKSERAPDLDTSKIDLGAPIDVVVTSKGAYYEPDRDFIFVADKKNHKVIKFRYDVAADSLLWVESWGETNLGSPTAIEYSHESDSSKDKIYVTDMEPRSVVRFSADGVFETSCRLDMTDPYDIVSPGGITVAAETAFHGRIYVCDLGRIHICGPWPVVSLKSGDSIRIHDQKYVSRGRTVPPGLSAIDADWRGTLYATEYPFHSIVAFYDSIGPLYQRFGPEQMGKDRLSYPADIYIDGDEMQVCEIWTDSTGIASYKIIPDSTMPELTVIPRRDYLQYAHPREFSDQTKVGFDLCTSGRIQLVIIDKSSQMVRTLLDDVIPAGHNAVIWDGRNESGQRVEAGPYYCKMITAGYEAIKPLLLKR